MRFARPFCAVLLLAGCGKDPAPSPQVFAPVRQRLTPSGGTISVPSEGGTLSLEVPPGALLEDVEFLVTPLVGGEFSFAPTEVVLRQAATLRFAAPAGGLGDASHFYWVLGGAHSFFPTQRTADVLSASVERLAPGPLPAAAGLRADADGDGAATLGRGPLDCESEKARLLAEIGASVGRGDLARAIATNDALEALRDSCVAAKIAELGAAACAGYATALSAANTATVRDEASFRQIVGPLLASAAHVAATGGDCATDVTGPLQRTFDGLVMGLEGQIADPAFADEFLQRRLKGLLSLEAECLLLDIAPDTCEKFPSNLYPPILDLLRRQAYQDCLDDQTALSLSQLYRAGPEPRTGAVLQSARFSYAELDDDVMFCTNPTLELRVFREAETVPEPVPELDQHLELRGQLAAPVKRIDVEIPRRGSFTLGGRVRALACPDATVASDELVFQINGADIARRPQHGNLYALDTAPLDFVLGRDLTSSGLDPRTVRAFDVRVSREGTGCGGVFEETHELFVIHVSVKDPELSISPNEVDLSRGETQQFRALLDGSPTTAVRWTANGGTVDANGLYTAPMRDGRFQITVSHVDNSGLTATATVNVPGAQRTYSGTVTWSQSAPPFDERSFSGFLRVTEDAAGPPGSFAVVAASGMYQRAFSNTQLCGPSSTEITLTLSETGTVSRGTFFSAAQAGGFGQFNLLGTLRTTSQVLEQPGLSCAVTVNHSELETALVGFRVERLLRGGGGNLSGLDLDRTIGDNVFRGRLNAD